MIDILTPRYLRKVAAYLERDGTRSTRALPQDDPALVEAAFHVALAGDLKLRAGAFEGKQVTPAPLADIEKRLDERYAGFRVHACPPPPIPAPPTPPPPSPPSPPVEPPKPIEPPPVDNNTAEQLKAVLVALEDVVQRTEAMQTRHAEVAKSVDTHIATLVKAGAEKKLSRG